MARRYLIWMSAFFSLTLLPVFALNLLLANNTLGNNKKALLASEWQQATHGVTYAPTLADTHLFKTLRLNDRLPEINGVVFGSSTALGVTAAMFPPPLKIYNFAQTGHGLASVIGEIEALLDRDGQVKWFIVPLDWSLGFLYQSDVLGKADLSLATARALALSDHGPHVTLLEQLRDALSYPRIASLFAILKDVLRAEDKAQAFAQYFFRDAGDDYRCTDGTPAKDFDTFFRGSCTGFRFDGSATFANLSPLSANEAKRLIAAAVLPSSKYAASLVQTQGEPNEELLRRLTEAAWRAEAKKGKLVLFMPPLLPGLEQAFFDAPGLNVALSRTVQMLNAWAQQTGVTIINAGQSERYGCVAEEFVDEHHALPACYAKVFARYWQDKPDAGLYTP